MPWDVKKKKKTAKDTYIFATVKQSSLENSAKLCSSFTNFIVTISNAIVSSTGQESQEGKN